MALTDNQKDALAEEMRIYHHKSLVASQKAHIEEKSRYMNLNRLINKNRLDDTTFHDALAVERREHEAVCNRDEKLAQEMVRMKNDEAIRARSRQLLRENNHELKALENKLKTAYAAKAIAAQIAEKEAKEIERKNQERAAQDYKRSQFYEMEAIAKLDAEKALQKKLEYKRALQDQMILKEKTKRYEYEQFLKERQLIDDIVARVEDENERERQERHCHMIKCNEEMQAFKAAQQVWKEMEIKTLQEEDNKINEYIKAKTSDAVARKEAHDQREALKAMLSEKIARNIANEKAKQKEREEIMLELLEQEKREAIEQQKKKEAEDVARKRREICESLGRQVAEREEKLRKEAEEDQKYKEELIARMMEDQKFSQLSAEKRRIKVMQIRKDLQAMMIENRKKRAEEIQFRIKSVEADEMEYQEKQKIVEEERLKMLKEHASNLIGYIPKGVLREEDLQHLGPDFTEKYTKKK